MHGTAGIRRGWVALIIKITLASFPHTIFCGRKSCNSNPPPLPSLSAVGSGDPRASIDEVGWVCGSDRTAI
ncbi:hypothetical protein F5Y17DRAFT_125647 [Xylariaceae sp. FL0594]|nr:hypothetical protein F5Y17DRAFT_125647 [Xylariaceae sp. FL0594]